MLSLTAITPRVLSARLRGYKWILAGQLMVMTNFLFLTELFSRHPFPYWREILLGLTGGLLLLMNYLSYQLVKELTESVFVRRFVMVLLYAGVILALITGMEVIDKGSSLFYTAMILSTSSSLVSFIVLFYLMTNDIFNEKHDVTYRLLGSACIYLGIGATFGLMYCLLELLLPGEFGIVSELDIFHFIPCYNFSFYTLAGMDSPFPEFSPLVKNISVIESIVSNLFIVLIVGRLLSNLQPGER
ncbi:MAG TPA: hypothetical protein VEB86_19835 [Chryseosolibacter sp.]|nr:hypothetical protein [Chryseosolibacter sp.]